MCGPRGTRAPGFVASVGDLQTEQCCPFGASCYQLFSTPESRRTAPLALSVQALTPAAVWQEREQEAHCSRWDRLGGMRKIVGQRWWSGQGHAFLSLKTHSLSGHGARQLHAEWVALPGCWHLRLPGEAVPARQLTEHSSRCFSLPW